MLRRAHCRLGGTSEGRAVVLKMRKTAYVDLSLGTTKVVETSEDRLDEFLGSRGYGANLRSRAAGRRSALLDPDNAVVLTSGLFSNTPWPAASRYHLPLAADGLLRIRERRRQARPVPRSVRLRRSGGARLRREAGSPPRRSRVGPSSAGGRPVASLFFVVPGGAPRPGEGGALMRPTSPYARDPCRGGGGPARAGRGIIGGSGTSSNGEGDGNAVQ